MSDAQDEARRLLHKGEQHAEEAKTARRRWERTEDRADHQAAMIEAQFAAMYFARATATMAVDPV